MQFVLGAVEKKTERNVIPRGSNETNGKTSWERIRESSDVWNDRGIEFVIEFVTCNRLFRECRSDNRFDTLKRASGAAEPPPRGIQSARRNPLEKKHALEEDRCVE